MQLKEIDPTSTPIPVSNSILVFGLDIFVLVIILIFSLFNIPRTLIYLANNGSKAFQGYLLRSTVQSKAYPSGMALQFVDKGPLEPSLPTLESGAPLKQPWHLPMYLSLRHPAASFMQLRFLDFTIAQIILMTGYTAAIFYAAFYESNPFTYPSRCGWVIASQIPFVYAFATKNNVIGLLVGVGYEKLNYLHRHIGRLMVIGANVHAIGYIYKWYLAGDISEKISLPYVQWGIVALCCFDLLGFFSVQYVRQKSYNLFFATHVVGLIVMLFAACLHRPACIPYAIAGSVVYGLDHIIRIIKTRFTTASLKTIPGLGLTQVCIPSLNAGWRPGQHVRLRILSKAMGLWGMTEAHPFTIASAANTDEGLILMCKQTGNWTKKLYKTAQAMASRELGQHSGRRIKVIIEGPYGGIGDTTVQNYSGAMFVVGGSGVTFALSAIQDLVLANDRSRVKVIDVVWSVTDLAALENFISLFTELIFRSTYASLRISVFYTRASTRSSEGLLLPPGITLTPGRPTIERLMDGLVTSMMSKGGTHGAFVAVCGPVTLAKDVAHAVRTFDANSKKLVGGIQFHEEAFGW